MGIQLETQSAKVTAAQLTAIAAACRDQLHNEVATAWNIRSPLTVSTLHHPSWYRFTLVDEIPEAPGALAYHDVDANGHPYGRLGVNATLRAGESISSVVSHECVELQCDIYCASWAYSVGRRALVAVEACDPVQADSYPHANGSLLSNFVTPWYFVDDGQGHQYDHLDTLTDPFTLARGGYLIEMAAGRVTNIYNRVLPALIEAKAASQGRTYWRHIQAALTGAA